MATLIPQPQSSFQTPGPGPLRQPGVVQNGGRQPVRPQGQQQPQQPGVGNAPQQATQQQQPPAQPQPSYQPPQQAFQQPPAPPSTMQPMQPQQGGGGIPQMLAGRFGATNPFNAQPQLAPPQDFMTNVASNLSRFMGQ